MADKTAATERLRRYGLPMPMSVSISPESLPKLARYVSEHRDPVYWYLRFDEQRTPGLPRVLDSNNLVATLERASKLYPHLTVILQERVTASVSGVMAIRADSLFIEHVTGELRALLRDGATPNRTLLSCDGRMLRVEQNAQEFHAFWNGLEYCRVPNEDLPPTLAGHTQAQLVEAANRVEGHGVVEWIEWRTVRSFFSITGPCRSDSCSGNRT